MTLKKKILNSLLSIITIIILIFIDQYSKYLVKHDPDKEVFKSVISHVFGFEYLENKGVAFGLAYGQLFLIIFFVIIITAFLIYFMIAIDRANTEVKITRIKFQVIKICLICMVSGAFGNLIDRLRYKYVVDFIKVTFIDFPIFNIADCYVTVSAFILLFVLIFTKEEELNLIKFRK